MVLNLLFIHAIALYIYLLESTIKVFFGTNLSATRNLWRQMVVDGLLRMCLLHQVKRLVFTKSKWHRENPKQTHSSRIVIKRNKIRYWIILGIFCFIILRSLLFCAIVNYHVNDWNVYTKAFLVIHLRWDTVVQVLVGVWTV